MASLSTDKIIIPIIDIITNIKKRLQLLYGSDYNLKINDSESIYEIELKTILYD